MREVSKPAYKLLAKIEKNPGMEIAPSDRKRASLAAELLRKEMIQSVNPGIAVIPFDEGGQLCSAQECVRSLEPSYEYTITEKGEQSLRIHREEKQEKCRDVLRGWLQFFLGLFLGWILGGFTFSDCLTLIKRLFA